jgi:radical SAM modification target selenobiotic family peptide
MTLNFLPLAEYHTYEKEGSMDRERIKKILAGLSIAGLMTGGVLTTPERAFSA